MAPLPRASVVHIILAERPTAINGREVHFEGKNHQQLGSVIATSGERDSRVVVRSWPGPPGGGLALLMRIDERFIANQACALCGHPGPSVLAPGRPRNQ